jgi:hypothetical protein
VSTTASNYLSRINEKFPVKGQDNDSQGFRDNFLNIKRTLDTINADVEELDKNSVKVNGTATFLGNTIDDVNLKNYTIELAEYEVLSGSIDLDYSLGNYHKFEISSGYHEISVSNWPTYGKLGSIRVSITTGDGTTAQVNFTNGQSLGPENNPFTLLPGEVNVFDVWLEGATDTVFVKKLNTYVFDGSTTTSKVWVDTLGIGGVGDSYSSNSFYTGTNNVTIINNKLQLGELAVIPNRVTVQLTNKTETAPHYIFYVNTSSGAADFIQEGAIFAFNSTLTSSLYTVTTYITTSGQVTISNTGPSMPDGVLTSSTFVTFTNPRFEDNNIRSFPTVVTLATTAANTETGNANNFKGSIYADRNRLEVAFNDFGNNNTNTFVATTCVDPTNVYNTSTDLVSAEFIHTLLPFGSVIMWYGKAANVPSGWAICDGTQGTPDLTNRFVIGASTDDITTHEPATTVVNPASTSTFGGTSTSIVVEHNHIASFTGAQMTPHAHDVIIKDTGHVHNFDVASSNSPGPYAVGGVGSIANAGVGIDTGYTGITAVTTATGAGVTTGTVTIANSGVSGVGANLPPYRALYYIMKIAGMNHTGL